MAAAPWSWVPRCRWKPPCLLSTISPFPSFHDALLLQQSDLWVLTFTCQRTGIEKNKYMDMDMGSSGAGWKNRRMSCSKLSLFIIYCTHWCSASCNTAQLVKDFIISPSILVFSAGWHYLIAFLLWEWFNQNCKKDQKFTWPTKVAVATVPLFVHHSFLFSFVTQ